MNGDERCDRCAFCEESPIVPSGGLCHRNPPTVIVGMTPQGPAPLGSTYTLVKGDGWCGEWKQGNLIRVVSKPLSK